MDRLPPLHAGLIALGTVVLLAGVLALSWRFQDDDDEEVDAPEHEHVHPKHEFPQTVLTPGSGFVADPPDTDETESALADDDEEASDVDVAHSAAPHEERPLLVDHKSRFTNPTMMGRKSRSSHRSSSLNTTHTHLRSRRRRAATLREVLDIWEELGDRDTPQSAAGREQEEEIRNRDTGGDREEGQTPRYGTFTPHHPPAEAADEESRSRATNHPHTRSTSPVHREADPTSALLSPDLNTEHEHDHTPRPRARTLPNFLVESTSTSARQSRRRRGRRRRSTNEGAAGGSAGGALFSELVRWGWWARRDRDRDDEDEGGDGGGGGVEAGRRRRRSGYGP